MTATKRTLRKISRATIAVALSIATCAYADDYGDARAELIAAYQEANHPAMVAAAKKSIAARPGFPGALFNLALAQTLNGDKADALGTLNALVDKGVDFGADELDEFAALREIEDWGDYVSKVTALYTPKGSAEVVSTYAEPNFVPEGIAIGPDGQLFLGSIRTGQLVKLSETPGVLIAKGKSWSVFGMRFHPDGSLWFASAAVPQLEDAGDAVGQTGLFRLDTSSGEITRVAILPQYAEAQVLGDLIIADENTLYATDSLTGAIYKYYIDSNEFEVLVERGKLGSPQGLVMDESGRNLYVADYIGGLYRVSLEGGYLEKLLVPETMTDYGIDGLYRRSDELIAIQNGVRPHRVAAFQLSSNGVAVTSGRVLASNLKEFDEPTLGVVQGSEFYFVANSHWNRFDQDFNLPEGLSGPIILKLSLD